MTRTKYALLFLTLLLIAGGVYYWTVVTADLEEPKYTVVKQDGDIEIRAYDPFIIATAKVSGARYEAATDGFRKIFRFISGDNETSTKISMTRPVRQELLSETGDYKISFVMPRKYTLENLPIPDSKLVTFERVEGFRAIAIRFSGSNTDENVKEHENELKAYISKHKLAVEDLDKPIYAFYDPPFMLPFLRRNEVMYRLKESAPSSN